MILVHHYLPDVEIPNGQGFSLLTYKQFKRLEYYEKNQVMNKRRLENKQNSLTYRGNSSITFGQFHI